MSEQSQFEEKTGMTHSWKTYFVMTDGVRRSERMTSILGKVTCHRRSNYVNGFFCNC